MATYVCPMHPEEVSDKPGRCKKCGMDLRARRNPGEGGVKEGAEGLANHSGHHEMMARDFKKRFFVALALVVPVLVLSPTIQQWFHFSFAQFSGQNVVLFVLASIISLFAAWPFYKGAWQDELSQKNLGMMTLVSLAVLAGYGYSVAATFFIQAQDFYWEISTLVLVLLLGHWFEMRAVIGASGALHELAKLIPTTSNLVKENGDIETVETSSLAVGNRVLVRPGEKIPVDAVIEEGTSTVNESMITGESKPVDKKYGMAVIAGTINGEGALKLKVEKIGKDTALSHIIELVKKAQETKPKTQRLADKAATWLTLIAIVVGAATFCIWFFALGSGLVFALSLAITVVVITCPHALGLAIPTVTTIATALAAKNGMLIKNMEGLEIAKNADYIVFDKTGTLTKGEPGVTDAVFVSELTEQQVLSIAASLEQYSEHMIAKAIVKKAKEQKCELQEVQNFQAIPGKGSKGIVNAKEILIGNALLLRDFGIELGGFSKKAQEFLAQEKTVVYVVRDKKIQGLFALLDIVREESKKAIYGLHALGLKIAMLTGDNENVASLIAKELDIDRYFAEVLPGQKAEKIKELQAQGNTVMMVGDGINDAPALTQANVGVAIGAGTDVAIESAHIVLVKSNPLDIVKLIALSRATMAKMYQNLAWATGYNLLAIPVASGVLYPWGIVLRPEWGAIAMTLSSIIVVFNALLLRRVKL